jgi:hypothetical protein
LISKWKILELYESALFAIFRATIWERFMQNLKNFRSFRIL